MYYYSENGEYKQFESGKEYVIFSAERFAEHVKTKSFEEIINKVKAQFKITLKEEQDLADMLTEKTFSPQKLSEYICLICFAINKKCGRFELVLASRDIVKSVRGSQSLPIIHYGVVEKTEHGEARFFDLDPSVEGVLGFSGEQLRKYYSKYFDIQMIDNIQCGNEKSMSELYDNLQSGMVNAIPLCEFLK